MYTVLLAGRPVHRPAENVSGVGHDCPRMAGRPSERRQIRTLPRSVLRPRDGIRKLSFKIIAENISIEYNPTATTVLPSDLSCTNDYTTKRFPLFSNSVLKLPSDLALDKK